MEAAALMSMATSFLMRHRAESPDEAKMLKLEIDARRQALREAETACDLERLPPASDFARDLGERWVEGEIDSDQAVARLVAYYTKAADG